jgi:CheY-like chemotaxis protein
MGHLPIIGHTANADPTYHSKCKIAGMDAVLVKPCCRNALLAQIACLVHPGSSSGLAATNASSLDTGAVDASPGGVAGATNKENENGVAVAGNPTSANGMLQGAPSAIPAIDVLNPPAIDVRLGAQRMDSISQVQYSLYTVLYSLRMDSISQYMETLQLVHMELPKRLCEIEESTASNDLEGLKEQVHKLLAMAGDTLLIDCSTINRLHKLLAMAGDAPSINSTGY